MYSLKSPVGSLYLSDSITITSASAVGSSTTISHLKVELPSIYRFISGGGIMRQFARDNKMRMEQFRAHLLKSGNESYDRRVDGMQEQFGLQNFTVTESRLAHYFIPFAYHILLICPLEVRAERRAKDKGLSVEMIAEEIAQRDHDDEECYRRLYGDSCIWSPEKFDLVIDTHINKPPSVVTNILEGHARWKEKTVSKLCHDISLRWELLCQKK